MIYESKGSSKRGVSIRSTTDVYSWYTWNVDSRTVVSITGRIDPGTIPASLYLGALLHG